MSDLNDWQSLIQKAQIPFRNCPSETADYMLVPLNEYQAQALLHMFLQVNKSAKDFAMGDWFVEVPVVLLTSLLKTGSITQEEHDAFWAKWKASLEE